MNRIVFVLICIICHLCGYADVIIPMEKRSGVYYIPCKVNGQSLEFIFDTGASSVCISKELASSLFEKGLLLKQDIIGTGTSEIADGSIVKNTIINIKELTISSKKMTNIKAVVIEGQNAPLLLGLNAIQKLGKIQLDQNRLIIKEVTASKTSATKKMSPLESALKLYYAKEYRRAAEMMLPLYKNKKLKNIEKVILVDALNKSSHVKGIETRDDVLEIALDTYLDEKVSDQIGADEYYLIMGTAFYGTLDNINSAANYRKAFECSTTNFYRAKSLKELATVYHLSEDDPEKGNNIYYDAIGFLVQALKEETGIDLSVDSFISACYTKEYKIYDYMSDELRSLTENVVYSFISTACYSDQISYDDFKYYVEKLIEAGNKYAREIHKGY